MKRILYILLLLVLNLTIKAQVTPVTGGYAVQQNIGSAAAIVRTDGAIGGKFVVWRFTDTTTANTYQIKNYPFALIATTDENSLWTRNEYATAWMKGSGSIDIDNFEFLNDSTLVICFSNGSCDTVSMTNFNTVVNNLVQNFLDSSIYNLNDSTLIICNAAGSCDTIDLGTTNSYFFLNDSTLITCDTVQIICVGDSCYQQQICDTIAVPNLRSIQPQNGLRWLPGTLIMEFGNDAEGEANLANLRHNTWLYTDYSYLTIQGRPTFHEPLTIQQKQWSQLSSSIASFHSYGKYPSTGANDENNQVNLYLNYFNPFHADTTGFFYNRIGYGLITNSRGRQENYLLDDNYSKQTGILFHTLDTNNTEGVTIFAQQLPSTYNFGNTPMVDSTLWDKAVSVFKTTGQVQFPQYISGAFEDASPLYIIAQDDEGNLVQYPSGGLTPGSGLLFARDDARNNSGGGMVFSTASESFRIDSVPDFTINMPLDGIFDVTSDYGNRSRLFAAEFSSGISSPSGGQDGSYVFAYEDTILLGLKTTSSSLLISNINNATSSNVLYYDPTSDRVTYGTAGITGITADNGLTANTSTNVQLGGTLLQNTSINATSSYTLTITGSQTGSPIVGVLNVNNTAGSGANAGIYATSTNWAAIRAEGGRDGIVGITSGAGGGVTGQATNGGSGVVASSTNGLALNAQIDFTSNNDVQIIGRLTRLVTASAAGSDGIGGSLDFNIANSTGTGGVANRIISKLTTASSATATSQLIFQGVLSASMVDVLTLAGDGSIKLRSITAAAASAITAADGMIVYVSDTDATFTSVGFWGREGGAWVKL